MKPKAKPTSATPAPNTPAEPSKRPRGRPRTGIEPRTGAERQAAYRKRLWRAQMEAEAGNPQDQPTRALLAALGLLLGSLDDPQKAELHDSQRWAAERAVRELCERYDLKPFSSP